MTQVQYLVSNPTDLDRVALQLHDALRLPCVIDLVGNLGSGKTTFVQHLSRSFGCDIAIVSPTFTLLNEYPLSLNNPNTKTHEHGIMIHADLYRLQDISEIELLGLRDYFSRPNTVTVVEWADRLPELLPPAALWLHFALLEE